MPNKVSSVVGEIWHPLTWLNQSKTFWVNNLVNTHSIKKCSIESLSSQYLTVILRGRAGYELIYITNEAVGRVGYYQLISGKSEKNNCFSKFSSSPITGNCH